MKFLLLLPALSIIYLVFYTIRDHHIKHYNDIENIQDDNLDIS